MASIVKRKNKFSVVYTYTDDKGDKRQKWETFATNAEAKRRKAEVEFQQESGTLVIPEAKTVKELLEDYTSIYGVNTWATSYSVMQMADRWRAKSSPVHCRN